MSKGNLIHTPHSDLNSAIELLDRLGVTYGNFDDLKKASSWQQQVTAAVLQGDPYFLGLLGLEVVAKKAGFNLEELGILGGGEDLLRKFHDVLHDYAEIKAIEHLIDCDADPYLPSGWSVEEHQKGGKLKFNPTQVQFYLSGPQRKSKVVDGNKLRKELAGKPVLNANVLDYLLKNPQLIPEDWKKDSEGRTRYLFFWGTIYRGLRGSLFVRCLYWNGGQWNWNDDWLGNDWNDVNPAALRAS